MDSLNNTIVQRLTIFGFLVLFIVIQTFFVVKGTGYFLIFPSLFLILTYKPESLGYGSCFILGVLNDLFSFQVLGISSVIFLFLKFFKLYFNASPAKTIWSLFGEYLAYSYFSFALVYFTFILFKLNDFSLLFVFFFLFIQALGFFICKYLWFKIFLILDEDKI